MLLVGTLNRVMIVELGVPASLVGIMISLPLLFAPFRALIGFRSDTHRSELGWRRVPFIWQGTLIQFGGLAIMPFALLVLSGGGDAAHAPAWLGHAGRGRSRSCWSAPACTRRRPSGLALATDLAPRGSQPKVVGLMYVMLLVGMIVSALVFGALLAEFHARAAGAGDPGRGARDDDPERHRAVEAGGAATAALRSRCREREPTFQESWAQFQPRRARACAACVAVGLGTMAFGMADILLEPYGGQVLGPDGRRRPPSSPRRSRSAAWSASRSARGCSRRGVDPLRMAGLGAADRRAGLRWR